MTKEMEKEMKRLEKLEQKELDVVIDNEGTVVETNENVEDVEVNELEVLKLEDEHIKELEQERKALEKLEKVEEYAGNEENKNVIVKKSKKTMIITIAIIAAILFIFAFIGLANKLNHNIYKGVTFENKDLSGMSEAQVISIVKLKQEEINKRTIKIEQEDKFLIDIDSSDFDLNIDEAKTVENIMKYGRSQNILKDTFNILLAMVKKQNIDTVYTYSEDKLNDVVAEVKEIITDKTIDDNYTLNEKKYILVINKGKAGNSLNEITFTNDLIKALTISKENNLKIKVIYAQPNKLDVDVVYSKVTREAKDAYIDKTSIIPKFIAHQVGITFDKEALKKVIDNLQVNKSAEFKLSIAEPKVKLADITWDLYNYQVSSYKTYFTTADQNRVHNLGTALNILNGTVIMPGETFSYNGVVGSASAAQGFKVATAFVGGTLAKEVGGGICQTVSTMYNAALLADLQIVQRKNHSLPVGYVPGSRDATVYYPSVDFKFKNTRNYPLKIVTTFNAGGNLSISLFGTKEESEAVVTISSRTISYLPCRVEYIQDSKLAVGTEVVITKGTNGYISEAYKTTKKDGKTATVFLSRDTYKPVTRVIRKGSKVSTPIVEDPIIPVVEDPVIPVVEPTP